VDTDKIIFGFSRPKGWFQPFSWAIRFFTWSDISHAYVKFYSAKYDRWLIYQASGLAVNFVGDTEFISKEIVVEEYELDISIETKNKAVQYAIDQCGKSYGMLQILGLLLVVLADRIGIAIPNILYNNNTFVCSELAADVLLEIGKGQGIDPRVTTPVKLRDFIANLGYKPK
jgi:hypothetical protein